MGSIARLAALAMNDLRHEWPLTLCAVLGVAVAMAPLLILFSLKYGLVSSLLTQLREDPRTREVRLVGQGEFSDSWFAAAKERPDVGFIVPMTRYLTASIEVMPMLSEAEDSVTVELFPTDVDDPLLSGYAQIPGDRLEVVISQRAAELLGSGAGDSVQAVIGRISQGSREVTEVSLKVIGVLPAGRHQRAVFFVRLPFLVAVECFRESPGSAFNDCFGVDLAASDESYASFRLYARSIYDVAHLREWLSQEGWEALTMASAIEQVMSLDKNLSDLFGIVSVLAGSGLILSMALGFWASVARKRKELCVLRLLGFSRRLVAFFPLVQSFVVAAIGALAAIGLYAALQPIISASLAVDLLESKAVARLEPAHMAAALLAITVAAALAAVSAGWRAARMNVSEGLRDE